MRTRLLPLLAAAALLGPAAAARAQQPPADNDDFQTWNMFVVNKPLSQKYRGYFEIQPRFGNDSDRLSQLLIRPAIGYELRPGVSVWLGYANVTGYQPRFTVEHRPFQQLLINTRLPRFDLVNRTRLEQRFLDGEDTVSHRLRHFVRGFVPLDEERRWAFVAQNELFVNLNSATPALQSGYDQNRTFVGLSRAVGDGVRLETGYQYVNVRVPTAAPDRHLHTILTMLFVNL